MVTVHLTGRVGKNPEPIKASIEGCKFSVACDGWDSVKKEKTTNWYSVTVWGKRSEFILNYIRKGREVYVTGELVLRNYMTKSGEHRTSIDVRANDVTAFGKPESMRPAEEPAPEKTVKEKVEAITFDEDDIPF